MRRPALTKRIVGASTRIFQAAAENNGLAPGVAGGSRTQTATYIAALSKNLHDMAIASDMPLVAYFLDMAHEEAKAGTRPRRRA